MTKVPLIIFEFKSDFYYKYRSHRISVFNRVWKFWSVKTYSLSEGLSIRHLDSVAKSNIEWMSWDALNHIMNFSQLLTKHSICLAQKFKIALLIMQTFNSL